MLVVAIAAESTGATCATTVYAFARQFGERWTLPNSFLRIRKNFRPFVSVPEEPQLARHFQQGNAAAVIGLIVSIFGVMFCWFPILGLLSMPISTLALLLSVIGLLLSSSRHGARQAEAVTGVCISLLALFVTLSIHGMIGRH